MLQNSSNYQKDLKIAGNADVEISQIQRHQFETIGDSHLAECALALKKTHPPPSPPDRHKDQPHHVSGPEAGRMFVRGLDHCTIEFENKTNGQEVQTL